MAHPRPQGTPNFDTRLIFVIGVSSTLLFITILIGIWAGFEFVWNAEVYQKQYHPPHPELMAIEAEQEALLDGTDGGLSIEEAMKQVVEQGRM